MVRTFSSLQAGFEKIEANAAVCHAVAVIDLLLIPYADGCGPKTFDGNVVFVYVFEDPRRSTEYTIRQK